ncbi:MAG: hypothetical protein ABDH66_03685 [Bacteroidia bacterium]
MANLYLGEYQWPFPSPLTIHQHGRNPLGVFFPQEEASPDSFDLLQKIIRSVNLLPEETTIVLVKYALSLGRIVLFNQKIFWVFGENLLPPLKQGVYDLFTGHRISSPQGMPEGKRRNLYILPSLNDMLRFPNKKMLTWQSIKGLVSKS